MRQAAIGDRSPVEDHDPYVLERKPDGQIPADNGHKERRVRRDQNEESRWAKQRRDATTE